MMDWKAKRYQGLDRDACPPQWKGIMGSLEGRTQGVTVAKITERLTDSTMLDAIKAYATEAVPRLEEDLTLPVDAYRQPEAPWS
jgi:hypothetical protein